MVQTFRSLQPPVIMIESSERKDCSAGYQGARTTFSAFHEAEEVDREVDSLAALDVLARHLDVEAVLLDGDDPREQADPATNLQVS